MRGVRYMFLVMVASLALSACSKEDNNDEAEQAAIAEQAAKDEVLILDYLSKITMPAVEHSSGIYYSVIQEGSGENPTANSTVTVKYEGWLLSTKEVFDATEEDKTAAFSLNSVIKGWQIGVPLIKTGGKIRLYIPSGLAYGPSASSEIPANSVLIFEVELVSFVN